jgi:hypothetical protein
LATSADGVFPTIKGDLPANQVSDQDRQAVSSIFGRAVFDRDVLARDEACFPQALVKRRHQVRGIGERRTAQEADHRHRGLLRTHRERPGDDRAAEKGDEIAPLHSS